MPQMMWLKYCSYQDRKLWLVVTLIYRLPDARPQEFIRKSENVESYPNYSGNPVQKFFSVRLQSTEERVEMAGKQQRLTAVHDGAIWTVEQKKKLRWQPWFYASSDKRGKADNNVPQCLCNLLTTVLLCAKINSQGGWNCIVRKCVQIFHSPQWDL